MCLSAHDSLHISSGVLLLLLPLPLPDDLADSVAHFRVDLCVDAGVLAEGIVVVHELTAGLLVQTRLREGHNQETLDNFEDVLQGPFSRIPVSLQGVHADFTSVHGDVWMEYLGQEEAFRGALWEPTFDDKFAAEDSTFVGRLDGANDVGLDVQHIAILVLIEYHAYIPKDR